MSLDVHCPLLPAKLGDILGQGSFRRYRNNLSSGDAVVDSDNRSSPWVPGTFSSFASSGSSGSGQSIGPFNRPPSSLVPWPMSSLSTSNPPWSFRGSSWSSIRRIPFHLSFNLSGPKWVNRFPASRRIDDLDSNFAGKVKDFLKAIKDANGSYTIEETYRPAMRAYLMHWSWLISNRKIKAHEVDAKHHNICIGIVWDHGNDRASIEAASEMVSNFHLTKRSKYPPSLESVHIFGLAIDMEININNMKSIKDKNNKDIVIKEEKYLYPVGKSYGVIKLIGDHPHWSATGR